MAAYLKEGAYLFLEKMLMVVFVLGIENGRLLVWECLLKRGAYCVTQIRGRGTVPLNMLSGLVRR